MPIRLSPTKKDGGSYTSLYLRLRAAERRQQRDGEPITGRAPPPPSSRRSVSSGSAPGGGNTAPRGLLTPEESLELAAGGPLETPSPPPRRGGDGAAAAELVAVKADNATLRTQLADAEEGRAQAEQQVAELLAREEARREREAGEGAECDRRVAAAAAEAREAVRAEMGAQLRALRTELAEAQAAIADARRERAALWEEADARLCALRTELAVSHADAAEQQQRADAQRVQTEAEHSALQEEVEQLRARLRAAVERKEHYKQASAAEKNRRSAQARALEEATARIQALEAAAQRGHCGAVPRRPAAYTADDNYGGFTGSPCYAWNGNRDGPKTQSGRPDMRFACNRQ